MADRFPIQCGLTISMVAAERAFASYAKRYGTAQSLQTLAERGGFGLHEFVWLYRGAREDEVAKLHGGRDDYHERDIVQILRDADVSAEVAQA